MPRPNFKKVTFLCMQQLTNFPYIEEDFDALTNYELLSKVVEYLNKVIANENEQNESIIELYNSFNDLKNYVDNYFENLDVQDEINNKLDEMVEDGTLQDIIIAYSLPKSIFRTKLYMSKIGRINQTNYINNDYYGIQAGCYIGNNQYVYPFIKNNAIGEGRLFKLDFSTGEFISYNDVEGIYHANGCCLKGNFLYFTQSYDDNNDDKFGIVKVNTSDLSVEEIININFEENMTQERILGVGYDSKNDKFYLMSRNYFYKCDNEFNVENVISYKMPISITTTQQGGTFYDDYICIVLNNENAIVCYDRNGNLHHIIYLGEQQVGNFFGEIENVSVYNNELYINSVLYHNSSSNLYISQFFKAQLNGGGLPQRITSNLTFLNNVNLDIEINKTAYNSLTSFNKFTSNGSYEKPFESIAEALANMDNKHTYTINIGDTNTYEELLSIYNKNIIIKGHNSKIGCTKISQSRVSIVNTIFYHAAHRSPTFGENENYITPLYITANSDVWIYANTGYDTTQCISDGMVYPCIIEGSNFHDGSSTTENYQKFISKYLTYSPLIDNSNINVTNSIGIKNNITHFSLYKNSSDTHTDSQLLDLTQLSQYTNSIRGFWLAINIDGLETEYQKFDSNNKQHRIVIEDFDNNIKYGFKCTYTTESNELRITPFKNTNGTWVRDTTTTWYAFYMFEI